MFHTACKVIGALFALLAPFLAEAFCLLLSRATGQASSASDTIGVVISVALGSGSLFFWRFSFRAYLLLLPAYIAFMGFAVTVFAFAFVCFAFGDCL